MTRVELEQKRLDELICTETPLWESGMTFVAGADEVGRGPLAGPVMAACVVMPADPLILGIYDSKKISAAKRKRLSNKILETALAVGFGTAECEEIDEIGIAAATKQAFLRSIEAMIRQLGREPDHLFTDSVKLDVACPVTSLVHADCHVYNVAAASIVAKVKRDAVMAEYAEKYQEYGFDQNSGYGTEAHRRALIEYGPSPIHRRSFLGNLETWKVRLASDTPPLKNR